MKYKSTLSLFFLLISLSTYSQNKKEQIQILNNKIDSLTNLSKEESLRFTALNNEFKATKNELKSTIQSKNEIIKNLNIDLLNQKKGADNKIDSLLEIYNSLKNQSKSDFNIITVNYSNIVNGYKVKVAWLPKLDEGFGLSNFIAGPAVLQFSNIKDSLLFSVSTNHFSLSKDLFSITYEDKDSIDIASLNTTKITLHYKVSAKINPSYINDENSFFFVDVDFDGEKELVFDSEFAGGTKSIIKYDVYRINDNVIFKLSAAPFDELDNYTKFNYAAKTITIAALDGYCGDEYTTYSKKGDEFIPTILEKMEADEAQNCIKYTFKVNQDLQLIKKELLKD
jgi:hypothetical protein